MNLETQEAANKAAAGPALPEPVLLAFAPLHRMGMGMAGGVVFGGGLFLMTIALLLRGGYPIGPKLSLLSHFFSGYSVTWPGSLLGLAWGFVAGFFLGYSFALAHNLAVWLWLVVVKSRAEMDQYGDFLDHM
ncbi:MAG: hypothetical protein ACRD5F_13980 [Candidatus Acidiferrales bacterium]